MDTEQKVARALLKIGAVKFVLDEPITFKSGIVSPVYVDNRIFPYHPNEWQEIIEGFANLIKKENLDGDIIAGVEAAGIPHSSALGFFLKLPSVFVRKQVKDHGTKKLVEGGEVKDKKVILIEDLVSTGLSSLKAVEILKTEGATVENCLVIVSYGFAESKKSFKDAKVNLRALTSFPVILDEAKKQNIINQEDLKKIEAWFTLHSS